jgi:flagellar motor switch/type III secretory pathway protein FliN
MNRSAGENLDILAGNAMIGYGEIVISETTTGVRITDFDFKE